MLSSSVREVDDIEPPAHAMALPDVHSRPAAASQCGPPFVYGGRQVLETPQYLTTDSRQRLIISDPGIPASTRTGLAGKNSFSILGGKGHRLQSPAGVAVDKDDNIYVADSELGMVLVYDQYGEIPALHRGLQRREHVSKPQRNCDRPQRGPSLPFSTARVIWCSCLTSKATC